MCCTFLPPLQTLEAWIELVASRVARETGLPIVLEGYDLPRDPRLTKFAVTPDPGVIEVNIHPAPDFRSLVDHTERLYGSHPRMPSQRRSCWTAATPAPGR